MHLFGKYWANTIWHNFFVEFVLSYLGVEKKFLFLKRRREKVIIVEFKTPYIGAKTLKSISSNCPRLETTISTTRRILMAALSKETSWCLLRNLLWSLTRSINRSVEMERCCSCKAGVHKKIWEHQKNRCAIMYLQCCSYLS